MPSGLEAVSRADGAWYDVDCSKSRVGQDGKLIVRFRDFPASDEELYSLQDLDSLFRLCSRPVEDFQCQDVYAGLVVCALAKFTDTGDERWMDAEVLEVCAAEHTGEEECSCKFRVRWLGVGRLPAYEIAELRMQGPSWVGIDCICNLEVAVHFEHPEILKWKEEMRSLAYAAKDQTFPVSSGSKDIKPVGCIEEHPNRPAIRREGTSGDSPSSSSSQSPGKQCLQPLILHTSRSEEHQLTDFTRKRTANVACADYSEGSEWRAHKKRLIELPPQIEKDPVESGGTGQGPAKMGKMSGTADMVAWRIGKLFGMGCEPLAKSSEETCRNEASVPYVYEDDTSEKISFLTEIWKEGYPGSLEDENEEEGLVCPENDIAERKEEPLFQYVPTRPRSNLARRNRFKTGQDIANGPQHPNQSCIASQSCDSLDEIVID